MLRGVVLGRYRPTSSESRGSCTGNPGAAGALVLACSVPTNGSERSLRLSKPQKTVTPNNGLLQGPTCFVIATFVPLVADLWTFKTVLQPWVAAIEN